MEEVIISVIMGVYNTNNEAALYRSIYSVLNQSFKKIEFIICDDGSNDGTYELLSNIAMKDERIILIQNINNMGLAATLNKCIEVSRGKYIARMDSDDISALNRLEEQYNFMEKNGNYDFIGCGAYLFDSDGIFGKRKPKEMPAKEDFLFNSPFIHPTIMIRTEIIKKVNGYRVSVETTRAEDYDMFMRLYYNKYSGYNLQEYLYYYSEDVQSYKKRKYYYRLQEAVIRYQGFKMLNLLPLGYIYIIKPLIVGLIPSRLLRKLKTNYLLY